MALVQSIEKRLGKKCPSVSEWSRDMGLFKADGPHRSHNSTIRVILARELGENLKAGRSTSLSMNTSVYPRYLFSPSWHSLRIHRQSRKESLQAQSYTFSTRCYELPFSSIFPTRVSLILSHSGTTAQKHSSNIELPPTI